VEFIDQRSLADCSYKDFINENDNMASMQSALSRAVDSKVGHLQHATSSQTFKARVALASWINTSFLPPGTLASMVAEASRKAGKSNRKGRGKEVVVQVGDIPSNSDRLDSD
jgi:hypothetical protein